MPIRAPRCFGIGGDGQHRLGRRPEQQIIDHRLVLPGDVGDLGGQREHDVEVADRQQVGLARRQPVARGGALALGAVPVAAGVVGDPPVPAVLAGLDVTAQRCGAAVLDRRHHLELDEAQVPGMGSPVAGPGSAEDVGDLERGAHRLSRAALPCDPGNMPSLSSGLTTALHRARRHPGVERGGLQLSVPQQDLDDADIDAVLQQVGGEAVAQRVRPDPLGDARRMGRLGGDAVNLPVADRLEVVHARGTASHRDASRPACGRPSTTRAGARAGLARAWRCDAARLCRTRPGATCVRCRCRGP